MVFGFSSGVHGERVQLLGSLDDPWERCVSSYLLFCMVQRDWCPVSGDNNGCCGLKEACG